jgi:hypothetical protein
VFAIPGSLFSREFAGFTGLVFKANRGRDGCTRGFGHGRYENLSGAISWLTFPRGFFCATFEDPFRLQRHRIITVTITIAAITESPTLFWKGPGVSTAKETPVRLILT